MGRPDVFRYHTYREFLKDWLVYLKELDSSLSMRQLAAQAGIGSGYLSMILAGERNLTLNLLNKLFPLLKLTRAEENHVENLVKLADSGRTKVIALQQMSKSPSYQKSNPNEAEFITYMSHWYYVAIREMAGLPDFVPDPEWIQAKLRGSVPLTEIKAALDFLIRHGYLKVGKEGALLPPKQDLVCEGEIYKAALSQFHRQMLIQASQAIEDTPAGERNLDGYTFSINSERLAEASKIIDEAMDRLASLEGPKEPDQIYHIEFAFFPLTRKGGAK